MAVFRVERTKGFTVMSNYHLNDKTISLKAKGLLSQMLSLPDSWDFTLRGLASINKESLDAIRTAVLELEKHGYITRRQLRNSSGKLAKIEYTIYEQPQQPSPLSPRLGNPNTAPSPHLGKPCLENPNTVNPNTELQTVLSQRPYIRIAGDDYPREVVKSRFLKVNFSHVEYVFDCLDNNTTKVRNIKSYLLAALYNAPTTMDSYYRAEVNHDLYG